MEAKFKVGDVLVHKSTLLEPVATNNIRLTVLLIVTDGKSFGYECRGVSVWADGLDSSVEINGRTFQFQECELDYFPQKKDSEGD